MVGLLLMVVTAGTAAIVIRLRRVFRRRTLSASHRAVLIEEIVRRECANLDREYERLLNRG